MTDVTGNTLVTVVRDIEMRTVLEPTTSDVTTTTEGAALFVNGTAGMNVVIVVVGP